MFQPAGRNELKLIRSAERTSPDVARHDRVRIPVVKARAILESPAIPIATVECLTKEYCGCHHVLWSDGNHIIACCASPRCNQPFAKDRIGRKAGVDGGSSRTVQLFVPTGGCGCQRRPKTAQFWRLKIAHF